MRGDGSFAFDIASAARHTPRMTEKTILLDMVEFGCPSCARAIEHAGRRLAGVVDLRVDLARREIHVTHHADADVVAAGVMAIVRRLGHEARLRNP